MKKIIFASTRENSGKSSLIAGIVRNTQKHCGYIKPFGDRLIYRRKKNIDHDANLFIELLGMDSTPEDISLGFDQSKLKFKYTDETLRDTLQKMAGSIGKDKDALFIEGGRDLGYGSSVMIDSISLARHLDARLVIIVNGSSYKIMDDIYFIKKYVNMNGIDFAGVIANKVYDIEDFENFHCKSITEMGVPILGVVPYKKQLNHYSVKFLLDKLFAKVIAGERGIDNIVRNVFIGEMTTSEALRNPMFNTENKLLITSGDRSELILAALEGDTSGVVITNNIVPQSIILSKASDRNIPLLLVTSNTYEVTKRTDVMEALLTSTDNEKLDLLKQLVDKYVKVDDILK